MLSNDSEETDSSCDTIGYHYPVENESMINNYKIVEKIGSGRFCRVYKVEKNDIKYAMKIYKSSSSYIEYYDNELKNHNLLKDNQDYKTYN